MEVASFPGTWSINGHVTDVCKDRAADLTISRNYQEESRND